MKRRWVIAAVVALILVGLGLGANYAAERVARERIDAYFRTLPPEIQVSHGRVWLGFFDMSAHVADVNFRTGALPPTHCDEFIVRRVRLEHGVPVDLSISTRGLVVSHELIAALAVAQARALGDRDWILDSDCDYTLDTARKTMVVKTLALSVHDLLRMELGVVLRGLDYDRILAQDLEAVRDLRLVGGHVSVTDQGLVDRIVDAVAARKGLPRDKVRDALSRRIQKEADRIGASSSGTALDRLRRETVSAAGALLRHHASMVLTCAPKTPVSLQEFTGLSTEAVLDRLNLHVTSR